MKIIVLVSSLACGGTERVATTLSNAWIARGDSVTLVATFSGGGQSFYELDGGIELIYLARLLNISPRGGKQYFARLKALRMLILDRKPDVVLSFLPNVNVAALAATAFTRVPCVICERSDPSVQPIGWMWRAACGLLYRYADLVSVQTDSVAGNIRQVYGGLKKIASVPNPLPIDLLKWEVTGSLGTTKTLLSLGRLSGEKRVDLIIEAFAELAHRYPNWNLHIYGEGPERGRLQVRIKELGLAERAVLKGQTTDPWRVMAEADLFVMASRYEGFPNALLEAMGVGLPCVSTDCPSGPNEISRGGKDAMLVNVDDRSGLHEALERLMSTASLRKELGQKARASVSDRYALEAVVKVWDNVFASAGVEL